MINFNWTKIENAETYEIQVSENFESGSIVIGATGLTENNFSTDFNTLSYSTTYYWRVRGINTQGNGNWSDIFLFKTTVGLPSIPKLVFPADSLIYGIIHQNFEWLIDELNLCTFEIQISENSDFSSLVLTQSNISTSSFTIPDNISLVNGNEYYWRVRSKNSNTVSDWSSVFTFEVNETAPDILNPNDLNAFLWLNSSAGIILANDHDNKVMGWVDQSGNNNNVAQSNGNGYPSLINNFMSGKDAIYFDQSNAPSNFNNLNLDDSVNNFFTINGTNQACVLLTLIPLDNKINHSAVLTYTDPNVGGKWSILAQYNGIDGIMPLFETPKGSILNTDALCAIDLTDNNLLQLVFNYDENNVKIWQNGMKVNNKNVLFPEVNLLFPRLNIGSFYCYTNYGGAYQGYLFHVAFWRRTLDEKEISGLYNWHKHEFGL